MRLLGWALLMLFTGLATAWLRDDGKALHAKLDFASDNTDDHGEDYAELRVGSRAFRVTDAVRAATYCT